MNGHQAEDGAREALATLIAKEEIRDLVLLYSRGVDRKDFGLLRDLYAKGSTDTHGDSFDGSAEDYVAFLERSLPHVTYSGHHVCNHLISVNGDRADGEVYALAVHLFPDREGGMVEDWMAVRYLDNYVREDGRWRFAKRVVVYDMRSVRPAAGPEGSLPPGSPEPSYSLLTSRLFARGARA